MKIQITAALANFLKLKEKNKIQTIINMDVCNSPRLKETPNEAHINSPKTILFLNDNSRIFLKSNARSFEDFENELKSLVIKMT